MGEMEKLKGYADLTSEQQESFKIIFTQFMSAHGTESRNSINMKSVEIHGRYFKICYTRRGFDAYTFLDPINHKWC